MSILISPLDLFWAVIKAHLPLRISIMISYTDIYEAHRLPEPTSISLIKSAALWIYSKACMINESEDPMQYHRLFHNFKTHSFTLTGSNRRPWVSRRCLSCVHEHLKTRQLLFFFFLFCWSIQFQYLFFGGGENVDMPLCGSVPSRKKIVAHVALTNTFYVFKVCIQRWQTQEAMTNNLSIQTT